MRLIATHVLTNRAVALDFAANQGAVTPVDVEDDRPARGLCALYVSPGWVDIQVNGFAGFDLNAATVQPDDVIGVTRQLWREGVARFCPTVVTQSTAHIEHCLSAIAMACEMDARVRASVAGIHLEGPYLSPVEGARGAHPPEHIRRPNWDEFQGFQAVARGNIRIVTLAPEALGAIPFIRQLVRSGVVVAIGHTMATTDQLAAATDAGATLSTHLGNGAPTLLPRHPNVIWDQLSDDRLYASAIFDGHHLPASVMRVIARAKGADKTILVSDAVALARMPPGIYDGQVGGKVELHANGRLSVYGTPYLAGSASSLKDGVEIAVRVVCCSLAQACRMASANPEALLGQPTGADAFTVFEWNANAQHAAILATIVNGDVVYTSDASVTSDVVTYKQTHAHH
jgi:N-acetylglucosamine-6-phosphate deacetylase